MKRFLSCATIRHGGSILAGFLLVLGSCSDETTGGPGAKKSDAAVGTGGNATGSGGNSSGGRGGSSASGGASGRGGAPGSGGAAGSGGMNSSGGAPGSGGRSGVGGATGSGGKSAAGGESGSGGSAGSGGSGGIANSGGTQSTGGRGRDAGPDLPPDGNRPTDGRGTGGSSAGGSGTGGVATGGTTGGGTIDDGCTDQLAKGITISEIAVFQAGKISVMKNGTEATPKTAQGAEIIQGRNALFRVYVTVDSGFQSRDLSARVMLNGQTAGYFAKTAISASSTELNAANSFNIQVPGSAITASLDYQVQVVECGTGSGTDHSPIFPATGAATLATRKTGPVKVTLVPVTSGGVTPNLDQTFSDAIKNAMDGMYPTSGAQVTVATSPITGCTITAATAMDEIAWSDCLDALYSRRRTDKPANDVYYVGVIKPESTFAAFCGRGCITGISPVASISTPNYRVSLVDGYLPDSQTTTPHEVGHASGLEHSPGCGAAEPDSKFPYVTSGKAYIGWVGWDRQQSPVKFYDPAKYTDIMAYCTPPWVSDYVYKKFADRIIALAGARIVFGPASTWRVALENSGKLRWGIPVTTPMPAEGDAIAASVLDAQGTIVAQVTVYRTPTSIGGAFYLVPDPQPGWAAIDIGGRKLAY